jgi:hypothetical protein
MTNDLPICHFCRDPIDPRGLHRHHLNHDHGDNRPENVVDAHPSCHLRYHGLARDSREAELRRLDVMINAASPKEGARILDALPEDMVADLLVIAMRRVSWD